MLILLSMILITKKHFLKFYSVCILICVNRLHVWVKETERGRGIEWDTERKVESKESKKRKNFKNGEKQSPLTVLPSGDGEIVAEGKNQLHTFSFQLVLSFIAFMIKSICSQLVKRIRSCKWKMALKILNYWHKH